MEKPFWKITGLFSFDLYKISKQYYKVLRVFSFIIYFFFILSYMKYMFLFLYFLLYFRYSNIVFFCAESIPFYFQSVKYSNHKKTRSWMLQPSMITKNLSIFKVLSTLITTKWDPEYCYFCAKAIPFSMTSFHRYYWRHSWENYY